MQNDNQLRIQQNRDDIVLGNSESRIVRLRRQNKGRKNTRWSLSFLVTGLVLVAVLFFLFFFCPRNTSASSGEALSEIKYKVVEIQSGDSLWSVASDNMNPGFSNIYEYIREIKKCNKLHSNHIVSGCYLMVPYYEID